MPESSHFPSSFHTLPTPPPPHPPFGSLFFLYLLFLFFSPREGLGLSHVFKRGTESHRAMPFSGCWPNVALRGRRRGPAGGYGCSAPAGSGSPGTTGRTGMDTQRECDSSREIVEKSSALAKPPKYALRSCSAVSRAPSALRWLRCLQRQPVQAGRALCSSHPADSIATLAGQPSV